MKSFKSYFHPAVKKDGSSAATTTNVELTNSPLSPPTPGYSSTGTPRYSGSRPVSIYPTGDFRNSRLDDITEIKCDVMVNWLHQQQLERLWTSGGIGEGVVLKKSRDAYVACPEELSRVRDNLFDAVQRLNVRVIFLILILQLTQLPDKGH